MGARAAAWILAVVSFLGWGVAAVLGLALVVRQDDAGPVGSGVELVAEGVGPGLEDGQAPVEPAADTYKVKVHSDGCGVIRTDGPDGQDLDGLTWSVTDPDGFQVLGRNALGETRYRHYGPGPYGLVLQAWGDDSYVDVSNAVTIVC